MPRVAVVGAGYGGVAACRAAARALGREGEVVLLDRRDHHLVRHECHRAIRSPGVADVLRVPGDAAAGRRATFRRAAVERVDAGDRRIATDDGDVGYDAVVVATGSRTAHYGVPGAAEALSLKDLTDARRIREAALAAPSGGRFVVCGGGLTGVQLAGEVAALADDRGGDLDVRVVEVLDAVLPDESRELRGAVARRLRSAGVVVDAGRAVVAVEDGHVELEDGERLECAAAAWTGGVTPAPPSGLDGGDDGLAVGASLRVGGRDAVFAVGDVAAVRDADGRRAPATAWAARDQGRVAGRNAARVAAGGEPTGRFRLDPPGTLVSVGSAAVAEVGGRVVGGRTARALKRGAAVRHLREVAGAGAAARAAFKYL